MRLIKQLPDPFIMHDGRRVTTVDDWQYRRKEIRNTMLHFQYGTMPGPPEKVSVTTIESQMLAAGETCEKLRFDFTPKKVRPDLTFAMDVSVWHPSSEVVAKRRESIEGFAENGIPALIYVGNKKLASLLDRGYMIICY